MKNRPNILKPVLIGFAVMLVVLVILFVSGFGEPDLFSQLFNGRGSDEGNPAGLPLAQLIAIVDILIAFLAMVITSRLTRRNENKLIGEISQAEDTLDALSQAVIRLDDMGRPTYLNPSASQLLNLPEGQLPASIDLVSGRTRRPLLPDLLSSPGDVEHIPLPKETRLIAQQGLELEVEGVIQIIRDLQRRPIMAILQMSDVTEEREWTRRQPDLWDRDPLTALPGHDFMVNRLSRVLERERAGDRPALYLCIALEGLEDVYRKGGPQIGDSLVRHLTALLRSHIRDTDLLAYMGAGRFGALLLLCPEVAAERIRTNIRQSLTSDQFHWEGETYRIGVRIGTVCIPPFSGTAEELFAAADAGHV